MRILHKHTRAVLYEDDARSMRRTLEDAWFDARIDLTGADLRGEDVTGSYLFGARLEEVDFSRAWLVRANFSRAHLQSARFDSASLGGTNWTGADLRHASFNGSDLRMANFTEVDLRCTHLGDADIRDVVLTGCTVNWYSRNLLSEILRRAARNDIEKLKIAGFIRLQRDWCWGSFCRIDDPLKGWALAELARWIKPDDKHPKWLDEYVVKEEEAAS